SCDGGLGVRLWNYRSMRQDGLLRGLTDICIDRCTLLADCNVLACSFPLAMWDLKSGTCVWEDFGLETLDVSIIAYCKENGALMYGSDRGEVCIYDTRKRAANRLSASP